MLLVNLDVDNLMSLPFVSALIVKAVTESRHAVFHCWGQDGGVTGRIACWAEAFVHGAGGYDQSFLPSGYQDIDLKERLRRLKGGRSIRIRPAIAGKLFDDFSLENAPGGTKRERTSSRRCGGCRSTWIGAA